MSEVDSEPGKNSVAVRVLKTRVRIEAVATVAGREEVTLRNRKLRYFVLRFKNLVFGLNVTCLAVFYYHNDVCSIS